MPHSCPLQRVLRQATLAAYRAHAGHEDLLDHLCRSQRNLDGLACPMHPVACHARPAFGARVESVYYLPSGVNPPPGESLSPLLTRFCLLRSRPLGSRLVARHPHRSPPRWKPPLQIFYPSLQLDDDRLLLGDDRQQGLATCTIQISFSSHLSLMPQPLHNPRGLLKFLSSTLNSYLGLKGLPSASRERIMVQLCHLRRRST